MTDKPRVIALVPARSQSKGVPGKNTKPLAGGPSCVERAIACAQASGVCDQIVVSTDDPEVMRLVGHRDGVWVRQRESWAATDEAPMLSVVLDVWRVGYLDGAEIVLILQPSSPLRQPKLLQDAVDLLTHGYDSLVSVQRIPGGVDKALIQTGGEPAYRPVSGSWRTRHQDVRPAYRRDGQLYGFRMDLFVQVWDFYGQALKVIVTDPTDALSIDTPEDWAEAERRLRKREACAGWGWMTSYMHRLNESLERRGSQFARQPDDDPAEGHPAYTEGDPARFESSLPKWHSGYPPRVRPRQDEIDDAIRKYKAGL